MRAPPGPAGRGSASLGPEATTTTSGRSSATYRGQRADQARQSGLVMPKPQYDSKWLAKPWASSAAWRAGVASQRIPSPTRSTRGVRDTTECAMGTEVVVGPIVAVGDEVGGGVVGTEVVGTAVV